MTETDGFQTQLPETRTRSMSSRTPEECVDAATDTSESDETRTEAIQELRRANECDQLEALVRNDGLDERFRREALGALDTRQCVSTLRELVEEGSLDREFREAASARLDERADD
jgi:hypothetical protein